MADTEVRRRISVKMRDKKHSIAGDGVQACGGWFERNRLVVVLLVAYLFLSLLVVEQGRTIENQKSLIRQLFSDSLQLNAVRKAELHNHKR